MDTPVGELGPLIGSDRRMVESRPRVSLVRIVSAAVAASERCIDPAQGLFAAEDLERLEDPRRHGRSGERDTDRLEDVPRLGAARLDDAAQRGLDVRGVEGFGANSVVHRSTLLEMSADLPILVEIVDTEEKIKPLLPHLESMVAEGMITMEYVVILLYRHNETK